MKTTDDILSALTGIFRAVLKQPDLELKLTDTANSIDRWDSINHAVLLSEIEKHFQMRFSMKDTLALESVNDICNLVSEKK